MCIATVLSSVSCVSSCRSDRIPVSRLLSRGEPGSEASIVVRCCPAGSPGSGYITYGGVGVTYRRTIDPRLTPGELADRSKSRLCFRSREFGPKSAISGAIAVYCERFCSSGDQYCERTVIGSGFRHTRVCDAERKFFLLLIIDLIDPIDPIIDFIDFQ